MHLHTSSHREMVLLTMVIALLFTSFTALAQGTGVLTGRVQDSKTGDALAGANVVIMNTTTGTAADIEGRYTLRGLAAGTWTVRASMIGYVSVTREVVLFFLLPFHVWL